MVLIDTDYKLVFIKIMFEYPKMEVIELIGQNPIKIPYLANIICEQSYNLYNKRLSFDDSHMKIPTFAICLSKRGLCFDIVQKILEHIQITNLQIIIDKGILLFKYIKRISDSVYGIKSSAHGKLAASNQLYGRIDG
jgi:hypothetical protein